MNNIGILYNSFVCFVTGITGLIVFFNIHQRRLTKETRYSQGLDYFCFFLGLIWMLIGIRALLTWFGLSDTSILLYKWLIGPLTYLHLLPAFAYFGWSFFKDKKKEIIFNLFFGLISLATIFLFYKYGFRATELSYWGNNIVANETANNLFSFGIFLPSLAFIVWETVRRYRIWRRTKNHIDRQLLGFAAGFLVYAVSGALETLIFTRGWLILLARIGVMIAPIIFYLSAVSED